MNFIRSIVDGIENWANERSEKYGRTSDVADTLGVLVQALSAMCVIFVGMDYIIKDNINLWVLTGAVGLVIPLLLYCVLPVLTLVQNHCGRTIMGGDYVKVSTPWQYRSTVSEQLLCFNLKASIVIFVVAISWKVPLIGVIATSVVGFQAMLLLAGKVYRLTKALNTHIDDKNAHK